MVSTPIFRKIYLTPFWPSMKEGSVKWQRKRTKTSQSFCRFGWYGHQILVWPIAAQPNDPSANQKGVFSVRSDAETGCKFRL